MKKPKGPKQPIDTTADYFRNIEEAKLIGFDKGRPGGDISCWARRDKDGKIVEFYTGADADAKIASMYKGGSDGR